MASHTLYPKEIDEGRSPDVPAPAIAKHHWKLRDVLIAARAEVAGYVRHRTETRVAGA